MSYFLIAFDFSEIFLSLLWKYVFLCFLLGMSLKDGLYETVTHGKVQQNIQTCLKLPRRDRFCKHKAVDG